MYKNYIFDFYGTLAELKIDKNHDMIWEKMSMFYGFYGAEYDADEFQEKFEKYGKRIIEASGKEEYVEVNYLDIFFQLFSKKKVKPKMRTVKEAARFYRLLSTESLELYPYVKKVLKELKEKDRNLYLLASAQDCFAKYELVALDLQSYFDKIYFSSQLGIKKPDPQVYETVIKENKLNPKKTVVIGSDYKKDILGTRALGVDSILIQSEELKVENKKDKPTHIITSGDFREILSIDEE